MAKNSVYAGIAYDEEYDLLITATNANSKKWSKLLIHSDYGTRTIVEETIFDDEDILISCILLCKKLNVLLLGTSIGTVRVYLWPVVGKKPFQFSEYGIHSAHISHMEFSSDYKNLFTCSKDNSLYILNVIT